VEITKHLFGEDKKTSPIVQVLLLFKVGLEGSN
jgi:hypothetical protein